MKKIFLTLTLVASFIATAQVKIGDNPTTIDANSLLELETENQGLLFPRVPLQSTTSYAPLIAVNPLTLLVEKQKGMTVYNTATTSDVRPGLYVNDGFNWIRVSDKNIYNDNAAITSARTVTLNNNDLTFTAGVGGTGKTVVASTFKTGGAVYGNYRIVTTQLNTGAWLDTDYAIIGTSATNISLPNASLNLGRIISYTNQSGSNRTYDGTDTNFKPVNNTTATAGKGYLMIATTSGWQVIGGY
jgi:hypothetical protein